MLRARRSIARSPTAWAVPVAVCFLLSLAGASSGADSPPGTRFGGLATDGNIESVAVSGTTAYVGGDFSTIGPYTGSFAAVDASNGEVTDASPSVGGEVDASVSDGSGGWYIGGTFTSVDGVARTRLAHVLDDGSLDTNWNAAADGEVRALAFAGGVVYVGGEFNTVSEQSSPYLAALDGTTGDPAPGWTTDGTVDSSVFALAVDGDNVYAGGAFSTYLAAFDAADGTPVPGWTSGLDDEVLALALSGSTLYAGGDFADHIGAFHTSDGSAASWTGTADSTVDALAIGGGVVYLGGNFSTVNARSVSYLAAVDLTGADILSFDASADSDVETLALSGSTLYAGGYFENVDGAARNHIAALNTGDGSVTSWHPDANREVFTLGTDGSTVFAGGMLTSLGQDAGVARSNVAAVDLKTGELTSFAPDIDGDVTALAVSSSGSIVYLGGGFTDGLVALNASDGTTASGWTGAANSEVDALAFSDDGTALYAGGFFSTIGGQARPDLAKLDPTTGAADPAFDAQADNSVAAIGISHATGELYVAGHFSNIGGTSSRYVARLDPATGDSDLTFPNTPNHEALSLALSDSTLYVGGAFGSVGASTRHALAAFDPSTGALLAGFHPDIEKDPSDGNASGDVYALAVSGSNVYAGGDFATIDGDDHHFFAVIDGSTGAADAWNPLPPNYVYGLATTTSGAAYGGLTLPPSAPSSVSASAADGSATVSFSAPATNGGASVTSYTVTASPGGATASGSASPIVVSGLANDVNHTFVVTATNVAGRSVSSTASSAVVFSAAPAPSDSSSSPAPTTTTTTTTTTTATTPTTATKPIAPSASSTLTVGTGAKAITVGIPAGAVAGTGTATATVATTSAAPGVSFAVGTTAVQLTVTSNDGTPVTSFAQPVDLAFPDAPAGVVPGYSADGVAWTEIPALSSPSLPAGYRDGWYRDSAGTLHILTLHATYFALLTSGSKVASALRLTYALPAKVKLSRAHTFAVKLQATLPTTVTVTLLRRGKRLGSWHLVTAATARTISITIPRKARVKGTDVVTLRAAAGGDVATATHTLILTRP